MSQIQHVIFHFNKMKIMPIPLQFREVPILSHLCGCPQNHAQVKMYIITTFLPQVLLLNSLFQFKSFMLFSKVSFTPNR